MEAIMAAIETDALEKEYSTGGSDAVHALRGVTFAVGQGEIYALLGPNGAGKTTLVGLLTTMLLPTRGSATVAGFDTVRASAEVRRRIGVTFQEIVVDGELSGRQVLDFHGRLYGLHRDLRRQRIDELAALVELASVLDRKAGTYSGGMKRRLELARGLMTGPQVLFLDEPTQGLDPQNRAGIWKYIRQLRDQQGITLLLTTHYMEEAEALADRVGIIDQGRLVVEGKPADLVRQMGADVITLTGTGAAHDLLRHLHELAFVAQLVDHALDDGSHRIQIGVDDGERRLAEVVGLASANGVHIHHASVARPSLGDVFLRYTGSDLRD
jgi:ABC-2 type transport system ATP-binding protein